MIVRVKDTGTGVTADILPKLFSKFVTNSKKGTGLGLYICKGIIEAHVARYGRRIILKLVYRKTL